MEPNESILQAAEREIKEECGVEVIALNHIGFMQYEKYECPEVAIVHVFTTTKFKGNPEASEEMNPVQWYHRKDLKELKMYDDFIYWEEYVFEDKFFCGRVRYNNQEQIVEKIIRRCDSLSEALNCLSCSEFKTNL